MLLYSIILLNNIYSAIQFKTKYDYIKKKYWEILPNLITLAYHKQGLFIAKLMFFQHYLKSTSHATHEAVTKATIEHKNGLTSLRHK